MLLVNVSDVLISTGVSASFESQVEGAVTSGIEKATQALEAHLGCTFKHGTTVDRFYPDTGLHLDMQYPEGGLTLLLSNLFVKAITSVTVAEQLLGGEEVALDPSEWLLNAATGTLVIPAMYEKLHVKVTYTSGFASVEEVDPVIKNTLLGMVPKFIINGQPTAENEGAPKANASTARADAISMVSHLLRLGGIVYRPQHSSFTPLP